MGGWGVILIYGSDDFVLFAVCLMGVAPPEHSDSHYFIRVSAACLTRTRGPCGCKRSLKFSEYRAVSPQDC